MSTLFIKTDGVSRQLDQDYTRYKEQEEILNQYWDIAENTTASLAPEDLGAVELELRVLKEKAKKYVTEIMPQFHSMPINTAPMDPFEDAVSAIQMYISQNQVPAFIQNIRTIHPVNQTEDVKGITGRDAALMVGEVLGVNDLYRVFTAKDPGDGHDLSFTEWLEAAGWSIIAFTPWKLAKLGKVAEAGKGLRVLDKVSEGEKSLSTMGTLSQWFNRVKSQSVEAFQRSSEQFNSLLRDLAGPQLAPGGVRAMRAGDETVWRFENFGSGSKGTGKISDEASEVKTIFYDGVSANSFKAQIGEVLRRHNLTLSEFQELKLRHVTELNSDEVRIMKEIRDSVPLITKDTLLQKTIPASDIEKYLSGEYAEIGGYIAKYDDVGHINNYGDVVESFRLDYTSWNGSRPFPESGNVYGKIKFTTNKVDNIEISYGERFGGSNTDGPPCTLNGFTGSRNSELVPEWQFDNRYFPNDGAELYRVTDGVDKLVARFDSDLKAFIPVK
ncbi:pre-toxin TG domain-containing protein [Peribacillus kribbensis]|uniref:pre-toxin TG domain-containing protein n=1 Tax=Peribacillus kribbensis TaxID=356658 RepID=UPI000423FE64|nr:pre-toxin TG domain-containing protein [Peribacillus kribbensis]